MMSYPDAARAVQEMYVAYYGRGADVEGYYFWIDKLHETDDLTQILAAFGTSPEFTDKYGDLENVVLINNLYQQLFNRDADAEGLAFYLDRLESGAASLASIAKQIIDGTDRDSSDGTILNNKAEQAMCFTAGLEHDEVIENMDEILDSVGLEDPNCARGWIAENLLHEEITITGVAAIDYPILDL